jgi:hypothetical protein
MSVAMFNAYELGNLAKAIEDASPGRNERILQTLATFSRLNTSMPARAILPHAASVAFRMDSNLTATDGTEFAGPPSFALEFMDVLSSFIGRIAHYADLLE